MSMRRRVAMVTVVGLASASRWAAACPGCFGSVEERVLDTYYLSTVMLSLLPFGLVGVLGGVAWLLLREGGAGVEPPDVGPPR